MPNYRTSYVSWFVTKMAHFFYEVFIGQWLTHSVHCECRECWPWKWEEIDKRIKEKESCES